MKPILHLLTGILILAVCGTTAYKFFYLAGMHGEPGLWALWIVSFLRESWHIETYVDAKKEAIA